MAKTDDDLPDPLDGEALTKWLKNKPRPLVAAFAARMALLALPGLGTLTLHHLRKHWAPTALLTTFRRVWAASIAAQFPGRNSNQAARNAQLGYDLKDSFEGLRAIVAKRLAPETVNISAFAAIDSAASASRVADSWDIVTLAYAEEAAKHTRNALLNLAESDMKPELRRQMVSLLTQISKAAAGQTVDVLAQPVWIGGVIPHPFDRHWSNLKRTLSGEQNWYVWLDWAEARFHGDPDWPQPVHDALIVWRKEWNRNPEIVNADIAALLAKHARQQRPMHEYDLFLSFSNNDLEAAKWVDDVLASAGYRVFFQPRDMPPGSNFVHEMNRGLEKSARLIALISPDYESSAQCQNEWAVAYNRDADAARRSLIQIVLRGRVTKPLSKQLVYVSLAGLPHIDQVAAILRAVGHEGKGVSIESRAPGLSGVAALKERIDAGYAVELSPEQMLTRKPAQRDDTSALGFSPEEFLQNIRQIVERVVSDCHRVAPAMANVAIPESVVARVTELKRHCDQLTSTIEPLALHDRVRAAFRQIVRSLKSGDFPDHGTWTDHRNDLKEILDILLEVFPGLRKFKNFKARKNFERMEPEQQKALKEWGEIVEKSPEAAAVLKPELQEDISDAVKRAEAANVIVQSDKSDEAVDIAADTNREMASKSLSLSDWLFTPRDMLKRAGKTAEEIDKATQPFENLYKKAKGPMGVLIDFFMQWL